MKTLLITICLLISPLSQADNLEQEINYLKNYIQTSQCKFNRNGDIHSASEALKHIEKKYQYYKDEITSAEQFIEKSASKSAITDEPYSVTCPITANQQAHGQQSISSRTWLLRALSGFRNQAQ